MPKYMAAGRNSGYLDNGFRDRESDLDMSGWELGYTNGENGNRDHDSIGGGGSRDRGRVRQKDIKERDLTNSSYGSLSSRSGTGSSGSTGGGRRLRGLSVGSVDREPGELSSESGSDEVTNSARGNSSNVSKPENGICSPFHNKKRKFSPIVWDKDEVSDISKCSIASTLSALPPPPPVPKSYRHSPSTAPAGAVDTSLVQNTNFKSSEPLIEPVVDIVSQVFDAKDSPAVLPASPNQELGAEYNEDDAPILNIKSSRWANDANTTDDEGEISASPSDVRMQKRRKKMPLPAKTEVMGRHKLISPEFGETKREGSVSTRARSSESDDVARGRSSSRENCADKDSDANDYMETDEERNNGGTSLSHADTDSEDEHDSHDILEPAGPPQRNVNMLQGCRSVDEFERLNKIDEGTYGVVYRAKDKKTGEIVALKKVKMEKEREGFPLTSLREINILLSFDHPSIVDVKEVVVGSSLDSIFMVMEYMEHDLKALMETKKQPFSQSEVKCLMQQLLEGVKYLHDNWVLHRDLKTSNLLLNNRGELKICDFGMARQYGSPLKPYTHLVVTLWYRAPELLLGAKQYSTAIDMWSLGCIMAELLLKEPLFNGKTEFDQIDKIFKMLGTPNETIWPGFSKLPGVKVNFVKHQYNVLRRKFPPTSFTGPPVLSDAGFDLLNKFLTYDPEKRITADAALNHEWFREVPLPKSKDFMPTFPAHHAQDRRTRRVLKSPDPLEEQRRKELQQRELGAGGLFGSNC